FEVKDIWKRNPALKAEDRLTPNQRAEWRNHLFWGRGSVSLEDGDRRRAWAEPLAESLAAAVTELESHPDVERAFEILYITEHLADAGLDSHHADRAAHWGARVRAVLGRAEFRLTPDLINQRLALVLGAPLAAALP